MRLDRPVRRTALALVSVGVAAALHLGVALPHGSAAPGPRMDATLGRVRDRLAGLVAAAQEAAQAAAALPRAAEAVSGSAEARAATFASLDALSDRREVRPALAIREPEGSPVAWTGRVSVLPELPVPDRPDVVVLHGAVTTTLLAQAPVRSPAGELVAIATAEIPLAVRRHIRNQYIGDFDRLATEPWIEVRWIDGSEDGAIPPLPDVDVPHRDAALTSPSGQPLALVRVTPPPVDAGRLGIAVVYRRIAAALLVLLAALLARGGGGPSLLAIAVGLRAALLALGPPAPGPGSPLVDPETFASALLPFGLLGSPLDLLLSVAVVSLAAALLLRGAVDRAPGAPRPVRWGAATAGAVVVLAATFAGLGHLQRNASIDVASIGIVPESAAHLALQLAALGVLASGAAVIAAAFAWAGPPRTGRLLALAGVSVTATLATAAARALDADLPVVPAMLVATSAAAVGAFARPLGPWLREGGVGRRAGAGLLGVAALAAVLHPTLRFQTATALREQIRGDYAAAVLRQPSWRSWALEQTRQRLDELRVLEDTLPHPDPSGVEQLAFALWSATDLAAFGLSSAVEVQDTTGAVVSRFALNLPSLSGPDRPLPASEAWETSRDTLRLGSATRTALHARRLLRYHGEVHGALHVYLGEDYWNLPFLTGHDPYSVLFRTASRETGRDSPVHLVAWRGGDVAFTSMERPPAPPGASVAREQWLRLRAGERLHEAWVFDDGETTFALLHPILGPGRAVADAVEGVIGLVLVALAGLLALVAVRTAQGDGELSAGALVDAVRRRFVLRLFVAFTLVAVVPVLVLQVVLRGFIEERLRAESREQALERAAVARKVVQDYAIARQVGETPVTDAALVLVASFIGNDLDLFQDGRLLASSKRELYASGLLPERAPGAVQRAIALESQPWTLRTERIGSFRYQVASVPVTLGAGDEAGAGILSIPLPLRQRELQATMHDLSRTIRLASVVFLGLAALLAHSMARRISGPIQDLTRAAHRVAQGDLAARVAPRGRDELRDLVEGFNRMAEDLDEQRQDLERSNRLAAWAEMARQVAHEVKNPLTPIQLSAEHLRRLWAASDPRFGQTLETCTQTILREVRNLRGMVTEFSAFARPPASVLEPCDPRRLVEDVLRPYRAALPPGTSLEVDVAPELPPVRVDRRLMERALVNLVENALQAVAPAGAIHVDVMAVDGRVEIGVEDSGPGIDPELRDHVFEPFFSTKTGGSGLGLALVKKIAEDHGGGVRLESGAAGTRATIWLPGVEEGR